jgi:hypothetical protein
MTDNDPKKCTLSGDPPDPNYEGPAPQPIDPTTGMHGDYYVLCEEERKKGFVRPLRFSYVHIGKRPKYQVRDLTPEEKERYKEYGYVKFEMYPLGESKVTGSFWTEASLNSGCGRTTTMAQAIAESYARNPSYYSATFCATCRAHFPVGENGEFVWAGTDERVGT